jgi:NADPH:quinone reductase-like Zn-dependent oxidoreductase
MPSATPVIPKTQSAVVGSEDHDFCIVHDLPVIECEDDMVIIKTHAVALNPVDTKLNGEMVTPGVSFGFDCAGTIVKIGSKVKREISIGDRVCGAACGMDKTRISGGAFVEYAALGGDLLLKLPDNMSYEDASTMGTALNSTAMVLFHSFGLPWTLVKKPSEKSFPVLVYGASSAVGTMAIQILRLYDLPVFKFPAQKN